MYRTNIKLSSCQRRFPRPLFFSVSLARAHVHVRRGSREPGPAGEYMLIYADREAPDILCRGRGALSVREPGPGVPSLPSLERSPRRRVLFHFARTPAGEEHPSRGVLAALASGTAPDTELVASRYRDINIELARPISSRQRLCLDQFNSIATHPRGEGERERERTRRSARRHASSRAGHELTPLKFSDHLSSSGTSAGIRWESSAEPALRFSRVSPENSPLTRTASVNRGSSYFLIREIRPGDPSSAPSPWPFRRAAEAGGKEARGEPN